MKKEAEITKKFERLAEHLNERSKRLWCANEAISIGWGGCIGIVSKSTGVSRKTISNGIQELKSEVATNHGGVRKAGGGRKKLKDKDTNFEKGFKRVSRVFDKRRS